MFYQSKQVASKLPLTESSRAGEQNSRTSEFIVPAGLTVGDIIELGGVPAYHVLDAVTLLSDQVDSNGTPTIAADVGYITGTFGDAIGGAAGTRTVGQDFFAGTTTPLRAGGSTSAAGVQMARQVAANPIADRGIALKVTAAAATLVVGSRIRLRVSYTADPGDLT